MSTGSPGGSGRWKPCEGGPTFKSALWRKEAVGGQILSCPAPDLLFHRSESQDREEGRLGAAGQPGQAPSLPVSSRGASFITLPVFLSGRELPEHGCQGQSTFGVGVQSEPEAPFLQQPPGALPPRGAGLWLHGQPKPRTSSGEGWDGQELKGRTRKSPCRGPLCAGRCQAGTGTFCSFSRSPPRPVLPSWGLRCDGHAPARLQPELLFGGLVGSPEGAVGSEGTRSRD